MILFDHLLGFWTSILQNPGGPGFGHPADGTADRAKRREGGADILERIE